MKYKIIQYNGLDSQARLTLKELQETCKSADQVAINIYWQILQKGHQYPSDLFCYDGEKLIGYLSYFFFSESQVEISTMVHPDYRRQGVFTVLFNSAVKETKIFGISRFLLSFPKKLETSRTFVEKLGAKFSHIEYSMMRKNTIPEQLEGEQNIQLQQAIESDAEQIATIDMHCFDSNVAAMKHRFLQNMQASNRCVWMVCQQDKVIGKVHVRYDDTDNAYVHDIGILPDYQKQGYGTQALKLAVNKIIEKGFPQITLDLESKNAHAVRLYENCGFHIFREDEFWLLDRNY